MSVAELHHLGVTLDRVPKAALLIEDEVGIPPLQPGSVTTRREFRCGRLAALPDVMVCAGALGAPAAVIALEEMVRAGVMSVIALSTCRCRSCESSDGVDGHRLVVPPAAVRAEGTSVAYAPPGFPAVPDWELSCALVEAVAPVDRVVVRTVDVPPAWRPSADLVETATAPVDLTSAALMVTASAVGIPFASLLIGRRALEAANHGGLTALVKAAARVVDDRTRGARA